ncbi:MAG TPA: hypothetical protein VKE40_24440 [Gemmataceae bacterium]|nr:hypothetical protein [Gemmataceae bacterium]
MNRQKVLNAILIACAVASLGAAESLARRLDAAEHELRMLSEQAAPAPTPIRQRPLPLPD